MLLGRGGAWRGDGAGRRRMVFLEYPLSLLMSASWEHTSYSKMCPPKEKQAQFFMKQMITLNVLNKTIRKIIVAVMPGLGKYEGVQKVSEAWKMLLSVSCVPQKMAVAVPAMAQWVTNMTAVARVAVKVQV